MRLIILLAALLTIGLLIHRQLDTSTHQIIDQSVASDVENAPHVPVKPQDVQKFGQDMNKYLNDAAVEKLKQIDQKTQ
jgi:predicted ribosome quality control (RQC) complex YloA/Tae2 family protein